MAAMNGSHEIVASQLAGDFVLPADPRQKCVFIAGGIGITPFRSMLQYLLDTRQKRPVTLFYTNKRLEEIVYKDMLDRAEKVLDIRTFYSVTDSQYLPPAWKGRRGRITPEWITQHAPGFQEAIFYISGPVSMVHALQDALRQLGIPNSQIKVDYFSGLA